jgi:hypothetical protein
VGGEMNAYQLLLPQCTLLFGVLVLAIFEILGIQAHYRQSWLVHTLSLALAFLQQLLLYRLPTSLFARGGMILDGTTQVFSLSVLLLSLLIQFNRREEKYSYLPQISILTLGITFFALFAVQSNRIFFGVISIIGMVWLGQAALAADTKIKNQADIVYSGIVRGLIFLMVGTFLCIMCVSIFGESQMDEIQRVIVRGSVKEFPVFAIEVFILFLASLMVGIPPFDGVFGLSRRKASWSLSLGLTGIFAIVGVNIFVRWGILLFTRPAIGAMELEPLTAWNILLVIRGVAVVGLVLTPLLALLNGNIRGSFLFFILNPFVQALFTLSFGQRETLAVGIAQIIVAVAMIGLLISTIQALDFSPEATLQDWLALGRKDMMTCLSCILALSSAAGLAPFYGSLLMQKTLSINSYLGLFLLLNIVLSGFYVGRLLTLAFHRGSGGGVDPHVSRGQKIWFATQFIILIFMGIFWQPLYKYGAFSIRQFFGEV